MMGFFEPTPPPAPAKQAKEAAEKVFWRKHRETFKIEDFPSERNRIQPEWFITSDWFTIGRKKEDGSYQKLEFRLRVNPRSMSLANSPINEAFLGFGLEILFDDGSSGDDVELKFRFGVVDQRGNEFSDHRCEARNVRFRADDGSRGATNFSVNNAISFDWLQSKGFIHQDGKLQVFCDIAVKCNVSQDLCDRVSILGREPTLQSKLSQMLRESLCCDVALVCGDQTLNCHKGILSTWSEVFRRMFQHPETEEAKTGRVVLKDVKPETVSAFLNFLYTAEVRTTEVPELLDLLSIGHKYDVSRLVKEVAIRLSEELSEGNVCEIFESARHFQIEFLEKASLTFAATEYEKVKQTDAWKELVEREPRVMAMVLDEMSKMV